MGVAQKKPNKTTTNKAFRMIGKHYTVTSTSGGETSSYLAVKYPTDINIFAVVCIDCPEHKTDKALIKYAENKFQKYCPLFPDFQATAEDDDTLWAMIELEQFLGKEIVWVRGKLFDDVISTPNYNSGAPGKLPSWARRYCTVNMKLLPIFEYLYFNSLLPCHMNIGFRADETTDRIHKFYFKKDGTPKNPHHFKYPINSNNFGEFRQNWESIYYRRCHFPLKEDGITKDIVQDFWKGKIKFPEISNCEGCFHKNIETIAYKCHTSPAKMRWWMRQEQKGKGTWKDSRVTYERISQSKIGRQMTLKEAATCDSGGCTD